MLKLYNDRTVSGMPTFRHRHNVHSSQMSFFCGHMPECDSFESEKLFSKAMINVYSHFSVVGLTEHFNASLKVLEKYLPRYFQGAQDLIKKEEATNVNRFKPQVSAEVKNILARNMSREIDFYHRVKQRLFQQLASLNKLWLL